MMIRLFLFTSLLALPLHAAAPTAGQISENVPFALRSGSTFSQVDLESYRGSILMIALVTPWCPICQTVGTNASDGILDHFNSGSRGALIGMNDNGVSIRSLLLSTEPGANWDSTNSSYAANNSYQEWGLDASPQRASARTVLGYYRDGVVAPAVLGGDRRRIVVVNLTEDSPTREFREILINQNSFSSSDNAAARAAINSVAAPLPDLTFSAWSSGFTFPAGKSGSDDDADGDGVANIWEYFFGTHPVMASSRSNGPAISRLGDASILSFRRARGLGGFTLHYLRSTSLSGWSSVPIGDLGISEAELIPGAVDQLDVTFPDSSDPNVFFSLEIVLDP